MQTQDHKNAAKYISHAIHEIYFVLIEIFLRASVRY